MSNYVRGTRCRNEKKITNKHIGREISKKNLKERKIIKSVEQKIL